MKELSYVNVANDTTQDTASIGEKKTRMEAKTTDNRMDVTALMQMLDKNRNNTSSKASDSDKKNSNAALRTISLVPGEIQIEEKKASKTAGKASKKKSSARGASQPAKKMPEKVESVKVTDEEAKITKKMAKKAAVELATPEEGETEDDSKSPTITAAERNANRNISRASRELQVKTQMNSRRIPPAGQGIAPAEYATVATLVVVALTVIIAILYLINDTGEVPPVESGTGRGQVILHDGATKPANAAPQGNTNSKNVEQDLLNIISQ